MSEFTDKVTQLLALIDHIDYGQIELTPKYNTAGFHAWYADGGKESQEAAANALVSLLFGSGFDVERATDIGHTTFKGTWNGLSVEVRCGSGAFCERVKVGEQVIPAREATPEHVADVYEWVCADPLVAVS